MQDERSTSVTPAASSSPPRRGGLWAAARALVLAVALLGGGELTLRFLLPAPPVTWDPAPYRDGDDRSGVAAVGPDKRLDISPDSTTAYTRLRRTRFIARPKEAGTFRVVVLGESAVFGFGLPPTASLPWRFERLLETRYPDQRWEVISLAEEGIDCGRLLRSLDWALAETKPDLVLVLAGNNEFFSMLAYRSLHPDYDAQSESATRFFRRCWLYGLVYKAVTRWRPPPGFDGGPMVGASTNDTLVVKGDALLVREVYERRLTRMVERCRAAGVAIVLCTVPVNLCAPPFQPVSAELGERLRPAETLRASGKPGDAMLKLQPLALTVDHPRVRWLAGLCLLDLGRTGEAKAELEGVLDDDGQPRRAPAWTSDVIDEVGRRLGVPVCDVRAMLSARGARGLSGDDQFLDLCHFSSSGTYAVTEIWVDFLASRGLIPCAMGAVKPPAVEASLPASADGVPDLESWPGLQDRPQDRAAVGLPAEEAAPLERPPVRRVSELLPPLCVATCNSIERLRLYGHICSTDDAFDDALACYLRALALTPQSSPGLLLDAAQAALESARVDEARRLLRRGLALRPGDALMARHLRALDGLVVERAYPPPLPEVVPSSGARGPSAGIPAPPSGPATPFPGGGKP